MLARHAGLIRKTLMGGLGIGAALLGACSGQDLSMGHDDSPLSPLSPDTVQAAASGCSEGFAHPNICCRGGLESGAECKSSPEEPFHPCDPGWTLYPKADTCCSLTDTRRCSPVAFPPAPKPEVCFSPCAPGWSQPAGGAPGVCCTTHSDGRQECTQAFGSFEAAAEPASSVPHGCPPGYQAVGGPESPTCCKKNADGTGECFGFFPTETGVCPEGFGSRSRPENVCCQRDQDGQINCNPPVFPPGTCPAGYEPALPKHCCPQFGEHREGCIDMQSNGAESCPAHYWENYFGACCSTVAANAESCFENDSFPEPSPCPAGYTQDLGAAGCCQVYPDGRARCVQLGSIFARLCSAKCAPGFSASLGTPQVCCQEKPEHSKICYSQSTGWLVLPWHS